MWWSAWFYANPLNSFKMVHAVSRKCNFREDCWTSPSKVRISFTIWPVWIERSDKWILESALTILKNLIINEELTVSFDIVSLVPKAHVMHRSISAEPTFPPPGNCGAFARIVSPGGRSLANPRVTPGFWHHVVSDSRSKRGRLCRERSVLCHRLACPSRIGQTCGGF